jgi:hypothetical protein
MLIEMFRSRFGEDIPLIRREHVAVSMRRPDWLVRNAGLETIRDAGARQMEEQALSLLHSKPRSGYGCLDTTAARRPRGGGTGP